MILCTLIIKVSLKANYSFGWGTSSDRFLSDSTMFNIVPIMTQALRWDMLHHSVSDEMQVLQTYIN